MMLSERCVVAKKEFSRVHAVVSVAVNSLHVKASLSRSSRKATVAKTVFVE